MSLKELKEKRSLLAMEMKSIVEKCEMETRSLNEEENSKFEELRSEIAVLDEEIASIKEEQRSQEPVEVIDNIKEEERGNVMEKTFEVELRGIESYLRHEDSEELRAMDTTSSGALIPTHLHGEIIKKLDETAPLFGQTRLFTPVNGKLDILREDNIGDGAWVGEGQAASPSDFKVKKVTLQGNRATATIQLSQSLLNDSGINLSEYALNILIRRLGAVLNKAIINGEVSSEQPEGLLSAPVECHVKSASKSTIDIDDIIDLYNSLHPEYLAGACFIIGRKEFNKLSKQKDANGAYYLQRDLTNGAAAYRLLGLPVFVSDVMPENTGAGSEKLVILANLYSCYATLMSKGVEIKTISNDSQTALNGNVLMVMDTYVDGKIINNDAVKVLVTPV